VSSKDLREATARPHHPSWRKQHGHKPVRRIVEADIGRRRRLLG
jgi:hypothetical protein